MQRSWVHINLFHGLKCYIAYLKALRRFNFWWRIASYLYGCNSTLKKGIARHINRKLVTKYNTEIMLGAQIGVGLSIPHFVGGIVIGDICIIGNNFKIRQNTTLGIHHSGQIDHIIIGDNVEMGANSCIIGENITIGSNVTIGAMSFINKDIPDNCIFISEKISKIKFK